MGYEICVLDPQLAATRDAAHAVWDDATYFDNSRPVSDRAAHKWRIREALQSFNPRIEWNEPAAPNPGAIASFFKKHEPERKYLAANLPVDSDPTCFSIYDQGIEIELPWGLEHSQPKDVISDLWRHLEVLSLMGMSTIYDTEHDVMLDLKIDFDAVLARYIKSISDDDKPAPVADGNHGAEHNATPAQAPGKAPSADQPFTGNVGESKPWWKMW